jgi:hypothetical protein
MAGAAGSSILGTTPVLADHPPNTMLHSASNTASSETIILLNQNSGRGLSVVTSGRFLGASVNASARGRLGDEGVALTGLVGSASQEMATSVDSLLGVDGFVSGFAAGASTSFGVRGTAAIDGGIGVSGKGKGIGVQAVADGGIALEVQGKAEFSDAAGFVGAVSAASFTGDGANLTALSATNIASGTLSAEHLPALDAAQTTAGVFGVDRIPGLPAERLTSGKVADARLARNIARLNATSIPFRGKLTAGSFGGPAKRPPRFAGSGRRRVAAGKDRVTIVNPSVTQLTNVLVMFQSDPGDVSVKDVLASPGKVEVVFSGVLGKAAKIGFFLFR